MGSVWITLAGGLVGIGAVFGIVKLFKYFRKPKITPTH